MPYGASVKPRSSNPGLFSVGVPGVPGVPGLEPTLDGLDPEMDPAAWWVGIWVSKSKDLRALFLCSSIAPPMVAHFNIVWMRWFCLSGLERYSSI